MGFDRDVPQGGYAWWYVDALSDDGRYGITIIAFIGSVFSPYYAWSRRHGAGDPLDHCALNVALYGGAKRWAMTERGARAVRRDSENLLIGPSALRWDGESLWIRIDERTMPFGGRLRGEVRVIAQAMTQRVFELDAQSQHRWHPLAPRAHVEVNLQNPALRWSGTGYLDCNHGDGPLEKSFASWTWSRATVGDETAIFYDVVPHLGNGTSLALRVDRAGGITDFAPPPIMQLPSTGWRMKRVTRAEQGRAMVRHTLEDTPFYARSILEARLLGADTVAMHESLSLERFRLPVVQAMLPFRMPRLGFSHSR